MDRANDARRGLASRRILIFVLVGVAAAAGAAIWLLTRSSGGVSANAISQPATTLVAISRRNLVETDTESGTLGYTDSQPVVFLQAGISATRGAGWSTAASSAGGSSTAAYRPSTDTGAGPAGTAPATLVSYDASLSQANARFTDGSAPGATDMTGASGGGDTIPPETTIDSGPSGPVTSTSATFAFSASEPSTFECSLDNAAFAACASPQSYSGLALGNHTFLVRAVDLASNVDPTPAAATWAIERKPPSGTTGGQSQGSGAPSGQPAGAGGSGATSPRTGSAGRSTGFSSAASSAALQSAASSSRSSGAQGGVVTWLPAEGQTVKPGQVLFRVNGKATMLMSGALPVWRTLSKGVNGPDVRELEQNLVALGFDPSHQITVDDHFGPATTAAVKRWQKRLGASQTGRVKLGAVVFQSGARRIGTIETQVGAQVQPGATIMQTTSTGQAVTVALDTTKQNLAAVGEKVSISLPGGTTVPGTISDVGKVAQSTSSSSDQTGPGQSSSSSSTSSTITVTIKLDRRSGVDLDQAPVDVDFAQETRKNVLAVPVSALLALEGGGYALQVADAQGTHLVRVTPGLYTSGYVEVSGTGIGEGTKVVVPA